MKRVKLERWETGTFAYCRFESYHAAMVTAAPAKS
jgi:hypothetical protein